MQERLTQCECTAPGWCERHGCEKNEYLFQMCQRLESWFQMWESGRGPGQVQATRSNHSGQKTCRHLGKEIRSELCLSCGGHVHIKVFLCDRHQECTRSSRLPNVLSCSACGDFEPSQELAPEVPKVP